MFPSIQPLARPPSGTFRPFRLSHTYCSQVISTHHDCNAQGLIADIVNNVARGTNRGRTVEHFDDDEQQNLVQAFGTFDYALGNQQRYLLHATYDHATVPFRKLHSKAK